jgi:hypothetical protein
MNVTRCAIPLSALVGSEMQLATAHQEYEKFIGRTLRLFATPENRGGEAKPAIQVQHLQSTITDLAIAPQKGNTDMPAA